MILDKTGNITIITQERATVVELVANIEKEYNTIKNEHLIINLFSVKEVKKEAVNDFLLLSKKHKASKKSFVIVTNEVSYEEVAEALTVVPTVQEAYDIIEMEEIERDLDI